MVFQQLGLAWRENSVVPDDKIVIHKNYLKGKQDELKMWRGAENFIIAMEATRASKACDADEELVLSEWRKGWWGKRRSQLRL